MRACVPSTIDWLRARARSGDHRRDAPPRRAAAAYQSRAATASIDQAHGPPASATISQPSSSPPDGLRVGVAETGVLVGVGVGAPPTTVIEPASQVVGTLPPDGDSDMASSQRTV